MATNKFVNQYQQKSDERGTEIPRAREDESYDKLMWI